MRTGLPAQACDRAASSFRSLSRIELIASSFSQVATAPGDEHHQTQDCDEQSDHAKPGERP